MSNPTPKAAAVAAAAVRALPEPAVQVEAFADLARLGAGAFLSAQKRSLELLGRQTALAAKVMRETVGLYEASVEQALTESGQLLTSASERVAAA